MALTDETESAAQTRQSVELRQGARDNQVVVFVHQRSNIGCVHRDEAGVCLVDEYHGVGRDVLHNTTYLVGCQAVTCRVIGRGQQQHTGMYAVGIFNDLVNIVGEGIFLLVQGVHLEFAVALRGYTVVVPPRELRNENLLVVTLGQEIVDGILQHVLATIGQQDLLFGNTVNFAHANADNTLLTLIVDTGIKTKILCVKILHCVKHLLAWLKIKFIPIKIVHCILFYFLQPAKVRISEQRTKVFKIIFNPCMTAASYQRF